MVLVLGESYKSTFIFCKKYNNIHPYEHYTNKQFLLTNNIIKDVTMKKYLVLYLKKIWIVMDVKLSRGL